MKKSTVLDLVYYPHEEGELRKVSDGISSFDDEVRNLASSMLKTMEHHQGIGLAGAQIGRLERIFVMSIDLPEYKHLPKIFINPEVIECADELIEHEEGCLSIPEYSANIWRPKYIKLSALDEQGNPFEVELEGLSSICAQHEIDHLNGKLFIDYISALKRNRLRKKMLKS